MIETLLATTTGQHFSAVDLGLFSGLRQFTFEAPEKSIKADGKVFLKQLLNLTSAEISINSLPPSTSIPFYHKHQLNEEIYLFLSGAGEFQVDGSTFAVHQGTVVRVDPEGERCLRNTSTVEDLRWVVVQARAGSYSDHTIQDGVGVNRRVSWVETPQS
jgi:mannose-6-phosphate isomerase-like protein (cupin superfamily)